MSSFIEDFKKFAFKGNAIDLAVGVIIGAAFDTSGATNLGFEPKYGLDEGIDEAARWWGQGASA